AAEPVLDVVHGAAHVLALFVRFAKVNRADRFRVLCGHAQQGAAPHPEQGTRPAEANGRGNAGDIAGADGGGQGSHQGVKGRDLPCPAAAPALGELAKAVGDLAQRNGPQHNHQKEARAENQTQHDRTPGEVIQKGENSHNRELLVIGILSVAPNEPERRIYLRRSNRSRWGNRPKIPPVWTKTTSLSPAKWPALISSIKPWNALPV